MNKRILTDFLILGYCSGFTFIGVYIFNYAEVFSDYTQAIFMGSGALLIILGLLILILKAEELFEYMIRSESILNMSEQHNLSTTKPVCLKRK